MKTFSFSNTLSVLAYEENAEPMDLDTLSSENSLLSSDCTMPSAESLAVTYICDSGEVLLNSKQYNVRKVLGHGAFGVCALVVDHNQEKLFAMKQIKKENFNTDEVSIMRSLEGSPYVIQFYDIQDVQQHFRLFMEYAQGGDLQKFLASEGELSESDKLKFFQDIMLGVCYIHSKLIVHADIKSQNILVVSRNDGHYRAVLSDFGLSLRTTCPSYSTMKVRGTVRYRSPELCQTSSYNTFSSDVWACGCVLVEIDTRSAPWVIAAERSIQSLIYTIGSAWQPPIPDGASDVLMKLYEGALALQPEHRRTANEICSMLESLEYERHQK